jgi:phage-related protein
MSFELRQWGREVEVFLEEIGEILAARALTLLRMLEATGNRMNPRHSKPLGDGLFELKVDSRGRDLRLFYVFGKGRTIVILGCLDKKTQKIPDAVMELVRERQQRIKREEAGSERININ